MASIRSDLSTGEKQAAEDRMRTAGCMRGVYTYSYDMRVQRFWVYNHPPQEMNCTIVRPA